MRFSRLNDLIKDGKIVHGKWELTPGHEVRYRAEDLQEESHFKAALIATEPEALVIALTEKKTNREVVTRLVKLSGTWKTNSKNQIQFEVARESGRNDVLTFKSAWHLNAQQKLVYAYKSTQLKTKQRIDRELVFDGYWDIDTRRRLTYRFAADSESFFSFRGAFQTASIYAKKGEIRYQLGGEVSGRRSEKRITLFGKWKVSRDLDVSFEMNSTDRKRSITFAGTVRVSTRDEITIELKTRQEERLGVELIWTRDISGGDGQIFMRLARVAQDTRVEAGYSRRF